MAPIRTPDDEVDKPGHLYPPFREGWWYQGATYAGHSDFSVDFNRRTAQGGWLQDLGDPVMAAADGKVGEADSSEGLVMLDHPDGYRTEYRHMRDILVTPGQKVRRGDRIGSIGDVAGSGRSTAPHLHHVHWKDGKRIKMRLEGKALGPSVFDSDTRPEGWKPPPPVMVQGPPPPATWESAYREAAKALDKSERQRDDASGKAALLAEELVLASTAADELSVALTACRARVVELENERPSCDEAVAAERARLLAAVSDGIDALLVGLS